jgi:hypothetical protein
MPAVFNRFFGVFAGTDLTIVPIVVKIKKAPEAL